jgi:hypothetical protein
MADGRKNNKGHPQSGRKSKAEEQKLIETLTPLMPKAFKALENALDDEEQWAVKLSFEYFYGKPKQTIDQDSTVTINDFDIKDALSFDKPPVNTINFTKRE